MTQKELISNLLKKNKRAIVVGSLGTISYDLAETKHKRKILIKGAMGHAMGCALGIAMSTRRQVICIIGDGSYLMKMGSISTIGRYLPKNLRVVVLVNECYASCGGQKNNIKYTRNLPIQFHEVSN